MSPLDQSLNQTNQAYHQAPNLSHDPVALVSLVVRAAVEGVWELRVVWLALLAGVLVWVVVRAVVLEVLRVLQHNRGH